MKARPLQLDLSRPPRRRPVAGLLVLVAGVLVLAGTLAWIERSARALAAAQDEVDHQTERVGASRGRRAREVPADPRELRAERAVRALQAELALPWDRLLGALESVQRSDVALLVVEPNAAEGRVRLQLEARRPDAMLAYLAGLQADPRLAGVLLQTHQAAGEGTPGAVRFQIVASWSPRP